MTMLTYCTFSVADLLLGIDVKRIEEVLHDQQLTPVPLAPRSVLGLLNIRGQIVSAIDARRQLGLAERDADQAVAHIIVLSQGEPASLVVDAEGEVLDVETDAVEDLPETVDADLRRFLTGAYRLDDALLLLLDADMAVSVTAE
jgi:purine-binding chemotaxis protein CheW